MQLLGRECKKIAKSIIYYVFIAVLIVMWYNNFAGVTQEEINQVDESNAEETGKMDRALLKEPTREDSFYGTQLVEDPEKIMTGGTELLIGEYLKNSYATYPYGYYKSVKLNDKEQEQVLSIIREITGLQEDEIENIPDGYFPQTNGTIIHFSDDIEMNEDSSISMTADDTAKETAGFVSQVSYNRFKELMGKMEKLLGNGSGYTIESLITYFGIEEQTYEQAVEEYEITINKDKVTGAFARLFCDYMGLPLALFPIFLAVIYCMQDNRSKIQELLYARKVGSVKLIGIRYVAGIIMVMIPVLLLSLESLIPLIKFGLSNNIAIDYFAYIKYIVWWLLPTVMLVWALGIFLTMLTDTPIAIMIQFILWYISIGTASLSGGTKWYSLIVRHNTLRGFELVHKNISNIFLNRSLLVLLSLIFLIFAILIYDRKRRGKLDVAGFYKKKFYSIKAKLQTICKK